MTRDPARFLEPLSGFVLEVLPWGLSSLIVLYLLWGFWSAPQASEGPKPAIEQSLRIAPVEIGRAAFASASSQVHTPM